MGLENGVAMGFRMDAIANLFENPDVQIAFQKCREEVLAGIDENFVRASSPSRGPWPPRAGDEPHPLLIKTGSLKRAATGGGPGHITVWYPDGFEVGVDTSVGLGGIPGAAAHNFGTDWMPQREFLAVGPETVTIIRQIIVDEMNRGVQGG